MPQLLTCPHCRNPMTVDETYAGLVVSCPTCRGSVAVPAPTAIVAPVPAALDFQDGPRARRPGRRQDWTGLLVGLASAVAVVAVLVGIGWAVWRYHNKEEVAAAPTPTKQDEPPLRLPPPLPPVAKNPKPPPITKAAIPEPEPPLRVETARDLLEKGRKQLRSGDLILAEQTWTRAMGLCGEDRNDQLAKAELYLRVGLVKEQMARIANYDPFRGNVRSKAESMMAANEQKKTLIYYERFYEILQAQGITNAGQKQIEIQTDQASLWLEYVRNR